MHTIEIDFEVFKQLTMMRDTEEVTYNDVVRKLLNLSPSREVESAIVAAAHHTEPVRQVLQQRTLEGPGAWVVKNIIFPSGTEFRASHKGKTILGRVELGALVVDGKRYESPSSAASAITGTSVNGWIFWECKKPGSTSWQMIKTLRKGR